MRHTTSQELEIARVYADTKATIFGFVFKAKVVKKKNRRNCVRQTRFNSSNFLKNVRHSPGAAFSAGDNASTSHDPEWVKVEPTQASDTTDIKAERASGACCVLCSGLQKKKKPPSERRICMSLHGDCCTALIRGDF